MHHVSGTIGESYCFKLFEGNFSINEDLAVTEGTTVQALLTLNSDLIKPRLGNLKIPAYPLTTLTPALTTNCVETHEYRIIGFKSRVTMVKCWCQGGL